MILKVGVFRTLLELTLTKKHAGGMFSAEKKAPTFRLELSVRITYFHG